MSLSGKHFTKEKIEARRHLERKRRHPVHVFIRSGDFILKSLLGLCIFTPLINAFFEKNAVYPVLFLVFSLLMFPFAKRAGDGLIKHFLSERAFEVINGGGPRGGFALYCILLILLSIPLGLGYFIFYTRIR